MSIRLKITLAFLIFSLPVLVVGHFTVSQINQVAKPINQEIPQNVQELAKVSVLEQKSQEIRYYDEVLTQAARNYAFTQEVKWKEIYVQAVPKLDAIIKEVIALGDKEDKQIFTDINEANLALVKMEENSLSLVDENKADEAILILQGQEYWDQKTIYKAGLDQFIQRRGLQYNQALTTSTTQLEKVTENTKNLINNSSRIIIGLIIALTIASILLGLFLANLITKRIVLLRDTVLEITNGNLQKRADATSKDEIGQLAKAFNEMTDNLQQTLASVETKVTERTAELEKTNKFMVDRELKMIELKKRITELETKS